MQYGEIVEGTFLSRPNRFIANVQIAGEEHICHVKNTGRCRELLIPGATVYLEKAANTNRKTAYSLVSVYKGQRLINIDSQAPNAVWAEYLASSACHIPGLGPVAAVRREVAFGSSRLDFMVQAQQGTAYMEVKGVTLEENGIGLFPDAPTQRGIRHLGELELAVRQGYLAYAVFVVQMQGVNFVAPNLGTHPEFGQALQQAQQNGVQMLAVDCKVTPQGLSACDFVEVKI